MNNQLKTSLDAVLGFFYPECCQICGLQRATPDEGYVCAECWQNVRFVRKPFCERCGLPFEGEITTPFECSNCSGLNLQFDFARSAVLAEGMVRDIIHRYKYQRALWFEPFLADLLAREAGPALPRDEWDMIVPVPLHYLKKNEREFNQAERLAAGLSRVTGIPLNTAVLTRVESTRTQTMLNRSDRIANVRHAFAPNRQSPETGLAGKRIIVFDDVLTTGATSNACATVLRQAGAARVGVWTLARARTA